MQKEEEDDELRFGYRVDLTSERHVRVEDEAKIASRGTDRMISLLREVC